MAGTIKKRTDKTWLVRIFLGRDENGVTKHFNKTIHGTKKDAQTYLNAKLREKDLGIFVEPASMPLSEHIDTWLEEVAKPRLRVSTYASYEMILRNYIIPTLGGRRLCDIQSYEIQSLYNGLTKRGLSARTVRYSHTVLSSALKQAIKWKRLVQNPCDHCDLPKMEKTEMRCFTPEETKVFLETAKTDKHYTLFLLAIHTGLRPEEYLGLQWKDIDFDQQALSVRRAVVWRRKGGGFFFTEPKTKKSRRSIPLSETLFAALKNHRRDTLKARMKLHPEIKKLDLVFTSKAGTPIQPKNLRDRHFFPIRDEAGLPKIRLYDLRHTTATLLLASGENPKVVAERLGHASIVLTLDTYSHVLPTMQKDASDRLENLLVGT